MSKSVDETEMNETMFCLKTQSNYHTSINSTINEIISLYNLLINEYTKTFFEKNIKNEYIFDTGLNTVTNVFRQLLINTRNLKITYYHSQQSYYIFLDFVSQLNNMNVSFLNLQTKDAINFTLRKTIFNINPNSKPLSEEDINNIYILDKLINIQLNIFFKYSNYISKKKDFENLLLHNNTLKDLLCSKKKDTNIYDNILCFQDFLKDKQLDISEYFEILTIIIGTIFKKKYCNIDKNTYIECLIINDNLYFFDDTSNKKKFIEQIFLQLI